jgi:hypothetical protein
MKQSWNVLSYAKKQGVCPESPESSSAAISLAKPFNATCRSWSSMSVTVVGLSLVNFVKLVYQVT